MVDTETCPVVVGIAHNATQDILTCNKPMPCPDHPREHAPVNATAKRRRQRALDGQGGAMTPTETGVDLDEVRALLAAATQGHWVACIDVPPDDGRYWAATDVIVVDELPVPDYGPAEASEVEYERVAAWADAHCRGTVAGTHNHLPISDEEHAANQRLIARAPGLLAALCAEVEQLRRGEMRT